MGRLYRRMLEYYEDWLFVTQNDEECFIKILCYTGKNGTWDFVVAEDEEYDMITFLSLFPDNAPEEKRVQVARWMADVNHKMFCANFEMDMNDGEVRLKTSVILDGSEATDGILKPLTYENLGFMDKYFLDLKELIRMDAKVEE